MKRENKYLVIKNADIAKLTDEQQVLLFRLAMEVRIIQQKEGKGEQHYVCVAKDWPMYETVYGLVEAFVDGTPNKIESLEQQLAARDTLLRQVKEKLVEMRCPDFALGVHDSHSVMFDDHLKATIRIINEVVK